MSVQNVTEAGTATKSKNTIQSIFDYILVAEKVLEIAAYSLSIIDNEIGRHLTIANNMLNIRCKLLLNLAREFPSDKENFCLSNINCPLRAHLFSFHKAMEEVNGNNDDMLLEGIEIVLNNNIANDLVDSNIIYSLSQIIDSEIYISNSKPSSLFNITNSYDENIVNMIKNTSLTIISLIKKSLIIARDKILTCSGIYVCYKCGFRIQNITKDYRCKFCGSTQEYISKINI